MIVYIDKGKTYCVDERGTTSNDLGILLFNYYDEHKRDRDLQEVIEHVILREGSLTYNYLEFSYNYNVDYKYSLQKFQMWKQLNCHTYFFFPFFILLILILRGF